MKWHKPSKESASQLHVLRAALGKASRDLQAEKRRLEKARDGLNKGMSKENG